MTAYGIENTREIIVVLKQHTHLESSPCPGMADAVSLPQGICSPVATTGGVIGLDHVGYAVDNIERYLESFFRPAFAPLSISPVVEDPIQKVRVAFARLADGTRIELIEPISPDSPIQRHLAQHRGGFYHLCYGVADIEAAVQRFVELRAILVSPPVPAAAFGGRKIAFVYTPQADLIEFVEQGGSI